MDNDSYNRLIKNSDDAYDYRFHKGAIELVNQKIQKVQEELEDLYSEEAGHRAALKQLVDKYKKVDS
jgi:hypothetical protein